MIYRYNHTNFMKINNFSDVYGYWRICKEKYETTKR